MTIEQKIFECAIIDFSKLKAYGFKKSNNAYVFEQTFMDGAFKAVVSVSLNGVLTGDVYDVDTNEIYFPIRVEEMNVGFAGSVRQTYIDILKDIKNKCCLLTFFINDQANRLSSKLKEIYGDSPVFPWEKYQNFGVFKNPDNGKWYALILNLNFEKLDPQKSGKVEIVNIKLDEQKIQNLITQPSFYPAYHMNKKNWITIVLNDSVDDETVLSLIDESHSFTLKKTKKLNS